VGAGIATTAQSAFVHAFQIGSVVTGGVALLGAAIAFLFLPARSAEPTERSEAEEISITIAEEPDRWVLQRVKERSERI
jgi:hypothetical protein